ncbi:hypothetical protein VPFG_00216 [Vibrio phage nt-1]|uniref:Uncharacterized protein n=1 Tax=Vibrio phage nt-1 TaxID=115992 RepID=R9TEM8_9CAUD|nr:hypothetical protein VPFG_00216 [Vibrio phage nt-1]AGN30216.1 hypothetical protein VPFG_00216 [Vibrio phage nt-1]
MTNYCIYHEEQKSILELHINNVIKITAVFGSAGDAYRVLHDGDFDKKGFVVREMATLRLKEFK